MAGAWRSAPAATARRSRSARHERRRAAARGWVVDGPVKALAFAPSPPTQAFSRAYGSECAPTAGPTPLLVATGVPNPGNGVQLDLLLAPFTVGVIGLGSGATSVPFPSADCQVQILPLWAPDLVTIVTTAAGTWSAPLLLPAGLPTDLYFQIASLDAGVAGGLTVSNPLQLHIL